MAKDRTNIPEAIAAEALFKSDHTCCVCRERGLPVQIHHIDEDPTHHDHSNLAVLCTADHDRTQVRGGFSRHLKAQEITIYRDDWIERVKSRRDSADRLAAESSTLGSFEHPMKEHEQLILPPAAFIMALPAVRRAAVARAAPKWEGSTHDMMEGSREYIDTFEAVLVALAAYFPTGQFGGKQPRDYFSEVIFSRFLWHRVHLEPDGRGTGGSSIAPEAAARVILDVERMVEDLVASLATRDDEFDMKTWRGEWESAVTALNETAAPAGTKKAGENDVSSRKNFVSHDELAVLHVLGDIPDDTTAEKIAQELNVTVQRTKFFLGELDSKGMVLTSPVFYGITTYSLTQEGRRLLFDTGTQ